VTADLTSHGRELSAVQLGPLFPSSLPPERSCLTVSFRRRPHPGPFLLLSRPLHRPKTAAPRADRHCRRRDSSTESSRAPPTPPELSQSFPDLPRTPSSHLGELPKLRVAGARVAAAMAGPPPSPPINRPPRPRFSSPPSLTELHYPSLSFSPELQSPPRPQWPPCPTRASPQIRSMPSHSLPPATSRSPPRARRPSPTPHFIAGVPQAIAPFGTRATVRRHPNPARLGPPLCPWPVGADAARPREHAGGRSCAGGAPCRRSSPEDRPARLCRRGRR
jgi:hypothetical protein